MRLRSLLRFVLSSPFVWESPKHPRKFRGLQPLRISFFTPHTVLHAVSGGRVFVLVVASQGDESFRVHFRSPRESSASSCGCLFATDS